MVQPIMRDAGGEGSSLLSEKLKQHAGRSVQLLACCREEDVIALEQTHRHRPWRRLQRALNRCDPERAQQDGWEWRVSCSSLPLRRTRLLLLLLDQIEGGGVVK